MYYYYKYHQSQHKLGSLAIDYGSVKLKRSKDDINPKDILNNIFNDGQAGYFTEIGKEFAYKLKLIILMLLLDEER